MTDFISNKAAIAALTSHPDLYAGSAGYVAAAIIRALPATPEVRVKPLEWQGSDPDFTRAYTPSGLNYEIINTFSGNGFAVFFSNEKLKGSIPTLEAAKSFAQAHHEASILAALEGGEA